MSDVGWRTRMQGVGLASRFRVTPTTQPEAIPEISVAQLPEHVATNSPAVLRRHVADWQPTRLWDPAHVAAECADRPVQVRLMDPATGLPLAPENPGGKYVVKTITASEAMAALDEAARAGVRSATYAAQLQLRHALPEILRDAMPPPEAVAHLGSLSRTAPAAYFGVGNRTPVHFDAPENLLCVVRGRKDVWLWHPGHGDAVGGGTVTDAAAALASHVVLFAGDAIYVPCCWWHAVGCPPGEVSISISYWAEPSSGKDGEGDGVDEWCSG